MAKRDNIGRKAIDFIKEQYRNGRPLKNTEAIHAAIVCHFELNPQRVTLARTRDWDRQARLELDREKLAVTDPSAAVWRERDPNAHPDKRRRSRNARAKAVNTAMQRLTETLISDASQVDATQAEIKRAMLFLAGSELMADVAAKK